MSTPLTLMAVHRTPTTSRRAPAGLGPVRGQGVRTVVVTCTNGELGDAPGGIKPGDEGHDEAEVARIRLGELERACETLGVAHLELLGYHDSGMVDWEHKDHPTRSATSPSTSRRTPLESVRAIPADIVVTYDERGGYDHPDHVHASRVTMAARSDGNPRKAYFTAFRRSMFAKFRAVLEEQGVDLSEFPQPDPEQVRIMDAVEAASRPWSTSVRSSNESACARDAREPDPGVVLEPLSGRGVRHALW